MLQPNDELRAFLEGVAGRRLCSLRISPVLLQLARRIQPRADLDAAQDLVGDLLLDLLERRGQAGGIEALLELSDAQLRLALLRRLRQVAAEAGGEAWRIQKQLRASVKAVLASELPDPEAMPLSITVGGRIQSRLVADAVASLVERGVPRDARALAGLIQDHYFGRPERLDAHDDHRLPVTPSPEEPLLAALDAPRNIEAVHALLGPDLGRAIARKAAGATLAEIGDDLGVATSSAHQRVATGIDRVRAWARRTGRSRACLEDVLAHVA